MLFVGYILGLIIFGDDRQKLPYSKLVFLFFDSPVHSVKVSPAVLTMDSDVVDGRQYCVLAENSSDQKQKFEQYIKASKCYLHAASKVTNVNVKKSLSYLSAFCVSKALAVSGDKGNHSVSNTRAVGFEYSEMFHSQRIIYQAHQGRLKRVELVSCAHDCPS